MEWFDELSDDELRARLLARGVPEQVVDGIVRGRDTEQARELIREELG